MLFCGVYVFKQQVYWYGGKDTYFIGRKCLLITIDGTYLIGRKCSLITINVGISVKETFAGL